MADTTVTIGVDPSGAIAGLKRIQDQTKKVSDTFNGLKSAIAGLAIGNFIINAIAMADAVSDLSEATGIAIDELTGFSNAVALSGGSAAGAQKAVLRLVQNIDEAAEGSASLQSSFKSVGVSLADLGSLSEADLLKKTISGLAKITDNAERAALSAKLLGKEFRGVSVGQLNDMLAKSISTAGAASSAFKAAAAAQDQFDRAVISLKTNVLIAIEPITKMIANLKPEQIEKFTKALVEVGGAIIIIAGAAKSFMWIGSAISFVTQAAVGLSVAFLAWKAAFSNAFAFIGPAFATLSSTMSKFGGMIAQVIRVWDLLWMNVKTSGGSAIRGLITSIIAIGGELGAITSGAGALFVGLLRALGMVVGSGLVL